MLKLFIIFWFVLPISLALLIMRHKRRTNRLILESFKLFKYPDIHQVTLKDISNIKPQFMTEYEAWSGLTAFPHYLKYFVRRPDTMAVSKLLISLLGESDKIELQRREDKLRAMTIASAIYKIPIPRQIVTLDTQTKLLYYALMREMTLIQIPIDLSNTEKIIPNLTKMSNALEYVGSILMYYAMDKIYPSFEVFMQTYKNNTKKQMYLDFTPTEIKSMITTYSALTKTYIPISYAHIDDVTLALMYKYSNHPIIKPNLVIVHSNTESQ